MSLIDRTERIVPSRLQSRAHRKSSGGIRTVWWAAAGIVVLAAGAALLPRESLAAANSGGAMARLNSQGVLHWHPTRATVTVGGNSHPLKMADGRFLPTGPLPAGVPATVHVDLAAPGPLAGLLHITRTLELTTPPNPVPAGTAGPIGPGGALTLHFNAPVAALRVDGKPVTAAISGATARVTPAGNIKPGMHGTVAVQTRARSWEAFSAPVSVAWSAVPWLQAGVRVVGNSGAISPTAAISVHFSQPVPAGTLPKVHITPAVPGHWTSTTPSDWTFHPTGGGWWPLTGVTVTVPGGQNGVVSQTGSYLKAAVTEHFTVAQGSTLRLQQLLADLGYLPLKFQGSPGAPQSVTAIQESVMRPAKGTFVWAYPNIPTSLAQLWQPGSDNVVTRGAVMSFEAQNHLTVDGVAGPAVWRDLAKAVVAGNQAPNGYSYVYVSETLPEKLWLWHDGKVVLTSPVNTGIPQTPTYIGTFPVFERLKTQTMSGTTPWGTHYSDSGIKWVNYFKGGDAVHGFVRSQYGFPQSLGCVELPVAQAGKVYPYLHLGALVTVAPQGSGPLTPAKS